MQILICKIKKNNIVKILNKNKKSIRYDLAHEMRLRAVPELLFIADDFEEKSQRVLKLFEEIEGEKKEENEEVEEDKDSEDEE